MRHADSHAMALQTMRFLATQQRTDPSRQYAEGKSIEGGALFHSDFWGWLCPSDRLMEVWRAVLPSLCAWKAPGPGESRTIPGPCPHSVAHTETCQSVPLGPGICAHMVWEVGGRAKHRVECSVASPFTLRWKAMITTGCKPMQT